MGVAKGMGLKAAGEDGDGGLGTWIVLSLGMVGITGFGIGGSDGTTGLNGFMKFPFEMILIKN